MDEEERQRRLNSSDLNVPIQMSGWRFTMENLEVVSILKGMRHQTRRVKELQMQAMCLQTMKRSTASS